MEDNRKELLGFLDKSARIGSAANTAHPMRPFEHALVVAPAGVRGRIVGSSTLVAPVGAASG